MDQRNPSSSRPVDGQSTPTPPESPGLYVISGQVDRLESMTTENRRLLEEIVARLAYWLDQPGGLEHLRQATGAAS